jgi:hypothetical protein
MKKIALISLFLIFLTPSCKREKDDKNNLLLLVLFALQQNSKVIFRGNFGGINSTLSKTTKELPDGITDVLAISAANHYHRSKIDENGNFSLGLVNGISNLYISWNFFL